MSNKSMQDKLTITSFDPATNVATISNGTGSMRVMCFTEQQIERFQAIYQRLAAEKRRQRRFLGLFKTR